MSEAETGQVTGTAAEVYDAFFVPALFAQWAARVLDAAEVGPGDAVLDVGCGTGVLAREAAGRAGPAGSAVGIDPNPGMLAVARSRAPGVEWREGRAEALPFDDDAFDAVVSQFALMFFDDPVGAVREMRRVTRPGGRVAVAVWDRLEHSPGYAALAGILADLFGDGAAAALRAPFAAGDPDGLREIFTRAGLPDAEVRTVSGTAVFPSLPAWMHTEIRGWTLADVIDDEGFDRLMEAAGTKLRRFVGGGGEVAFEVPAHIVVARA